MSSKFDWNIFQPYWLKLMRTAPKHCEYFLASKLSHLGLIFNFACLEPALVVSGTGKVVKNWSKKFFAIPTRNNKNCTPNSPDMFWVQNRVMRTRAKRKIWPKHFLAVLKGNDKNCAPKRGGNDSGAKPSYSSPVFSFTCSSGVWARKSWQNSIEIFFSCTDRKL